jgi:hypothetical protein
MTHLPARDTIKYNQGRGVRRLERIDGSDRPDLGAGAILLIPRNERPDPAQGMDTPKAEERGSFP